MATAPRKGANPARKKGSAPDNGGLSEYNIASGYATALAAGDIVQTTTDGTIIRAENNASSLGSLHGVEYVDADGNIRITKYWPASQTSTATPKALVLDDPDATFHMLADGPVTIVLPGDIYAVNLTAPDQSTGRSTQTVAVTTSVTGSEDLSATADIGADITNVDDGDAFTIKSSVANDLVTITIGATETGASLVAQLNNVEGISAELVSGSGFLKVTATDGGDIVLADGAGTPLADSNLLDAAGTYTSVVAANAGLVKVMKVVDADTRQLEVILVNSELRENG